MFTIYKFIVKKSLEFFYFAYVSEIKLIINIRVGWCAVIYITIQNLKSFIQNCIVSYRSCAQNVSSLILLNKKKHSSHGVIKKIILKLISENFNFNFNSDFKLFNFYIDLSWRKFKKLKKQLYQNACKCNDLQHLFVKGSLLWIFKNMIF